MREEKKEEGEKVIFLFYPLLSLPTFYSLRSIRLRDKRRIGRKREMERDW